MAHVEPGDAREEHDERSKRDCLDCGVCENCIDRAMDYAAEQEEYEMQIECPYCDGNGWVATRPTDGDGTISVECAECGGTGWQ